MVQYSVYTHKFVASELTKPLMMPHREEMHHGQQNSPVSYKFYVGMPHLPQEFLRAFYALSDCAKHVNSFINSTAGCFCEKIFFRAEGAHNIRLAYSSCFGKNIRLFTASNYSIRRKFIFNSMFVCNRVFQCESYFFAA